MMRLPITLLHIATLVVFCAACAGEPHVEPLEPVTVFVTNRLRNGVDLYAGGRALGGLASGVTVEITVPPGPVEWIQQPLRRVDGTPIEDDLVGGSVQAVESGRLLLVENLVGADTYVVPDIENYSGTTVSAAVVKGTSLRCISPIPHASFYGQLGYYRLTTTLKVQVYRGESCAGSYVTYGYETLQQFTESSGRVGIPVFSDP